MLHNHPSENIKRNAYPTPDTACNQCFRQSRVLQSPHIEKTKYGKADDIIQRMPRFCLFVAFSHGCIIHRLHMQNIDIEHRVQDSYRGDKQITRPEP